MRHKEYTLNLLHQIISETRDKDFEEFKVDGELREMVFFKLKEIGEASREMVDITDEGDLNETQRNIFKKLAAHRNARYNQKAEMSIRHVWRIVKNDLPLIEDKLAPNSGEVSGKE